MHKYGISDLPQGCKAGRFWTLSCWRMRTWVAGTSVCAAGIPSCVMTLNDVCSCPLSLVEADIPQYYHLPFSCSQS